MKLQLDTNLNTIQIIGKVDQLYSSFECSYVVNSTKSEGK